ncbi:MAG: MFS transporter, partial [Mesorhizobium sp.]
MDQTVDNRTTMRTMASPSISESEKNAIIGGVLLSMLLAALDQTIVSPALPTIARALGHAEYLPWIVTGYLLTATAMAPLYGKISDVYGRRPVIYAAILIFLLGSLVSALAPDMLVLVIGRAIQGAGGGGLFALTQTVIGDLVPPRERARYAAWISGTWAVASVAGPLLGGVFAEHLHWSLIFWINLPIGFLAMAIINNPLKKLPIAAKHHRIDGLGAVLLVIATALLLLALNWGGSTYPWFSPEILGLVACSAAFWALFALRLLRASEPLISLEVLGNRIVLAGTLSMFLLQAANIGASVYLPVYLQSVVGLSVSESGIAMLGLLLGTVAGATFSGRMIPRFVHYKRIAMVGVSLAIACIGVLSAIATHASLLEVEILTTLIGLGSGTTFPVSTVSVQNAVDRAHLGVATGVLTFLRTLGGALGVALLGAVALGYG